MSERMIEEMAKALCDRWGDTWRGGNDFHRDTARAVLTRLREPTPGMVEAGLVHIQGLSLTYLGNALELAFTAMIEAAMEGK